MFLEIGRAYHTLGNEQRRAKYDATFKACLEKDDGTETPAKPYETYRDAFDEIVASLSEDAFATTLGVFLLTGGIVGCIAGNRLGNSKTAGRILGSLFGFFFTSEMTGRAFIRFHRETVARVVYKKECQHCVEQSLPMPEPPPPNKLLQSLHECMISFKEQVSRMMLGFGRRSAAKP
ncbi:hypothetical protein FisN_9Hu311 [Fistulifera solaris]|jgi:DnaJ-class molecular chaperone|uniref:Uncharacterized protein n=1 Tax=Fistulifera solaris TaxID=1519565 RepID=A0A1Z5KD86_FISSO|nr:hypothetical protein FisN_9Hu311 [Fistulifera solaris]|eukprot:GAX24061.1 hypothetical protein FisN_9Hu311 [Fistulifera solaris]